MEQSLSQAWLNVFFFALVVFAITWWETQRKNKMSLVDLAWVGCFFPIVLCLALYGTGAPLRRALLLATAGFWSLRLFFHLRVRVRAHSEDPRYARLKEKWGATWARKAIFVFFAQALLVALLSWPMLLIARNPAPDISILEWSGALLALISIWGEATADQQLKRFLARPDSRGKTCREGLWRYSRHPNYFFEWLFWCGIFVLALASPLGWTSLFAPPLMLFFLLKLTGIPQTEAQAVRSRGDDYRDYQKRTSYFIPWPPKN